MRDTAAPEPAEHLGHHADVGDVGNVGDPGDAGGEQGRGHELESGVLGPLDAHLAGERTAPANDDGFHGLKDTAIPRRRIAPARYRSRDWQPNARGREPRSKVRRGFYVLRACACSPALLGLLELELVPRPVHLGDGALLLGLGGKLGELRGGESRTPP